jgi:hypothetical protein
MGDRDFLICSCGLRNRWGGHCMDIALIILLPIALGMAGYLITRRRALRRKSSRFLSYTFENSGAANVPRQAVEGAGFQERTR